MEIKQLLTRFMRAFFHLLYHQLARSYDFVAAIVSVGMWHDWVSSVMPYLKGPRVLELGHGPGHLQAALQERGVIAYGIDESRQMGRLARKRLSKRFSPANIINGYAQRLPFQGEVFQRVVATFPSEYILNQQTLAEAYRVLAPEGMLVVLPVVWITGQSRIERAAANLFRVTGQTLDWDDKMLAPFSKAGFQPHKKRITYKSWVALVIIAQKE